MRQFSLRLLPSQWNATDTSTFGYYVGGSWSTEGDLSANIYNNISQSVTADSYESLWQNVDLTGISQIVFDASLSAHGVDPKAVFNHFEAAFLVDGVPLWQQTQGGVYLDQVVNVSGLSGWHRIEIRNTALLSALHTTSYWTQWDNLRVIRGPVAIAAVVEVRPKTLTLGSHNKWITCYIQLPDGYDPEGIDASTVKLESIAAHLGKEGWATAEGNPANTADRDGDGTAERMVKFDRSAVEALVLPGEITVTVTGSLSGGVLFTGTDMIQVIEKEHNGRNGEKGGKGERDGNDHRGGDGQECEKGEKGPGDQHDDRAGEGPRGDRGGRNR